MLSRQIIATVNGNDWIMYMYTKYVDDFYSAQEVLPLGSRWDEGKVVVREELVEEDRQVPGDLRTARVICGAANTIDDMIKMVFDCPSLHEDRLMPILDLNVKVSQQGDIHYTMGNIGRLYRVSAISPYHQHFLTCFLASLGEFWFLCNP